MGFSIAQYFQYKKQLKDKLAAKSREGMERRHCFFNAENEIFPDDPNNSSRDSEEGIEIIDKQNDDKLNEGTDADELETNFDDEYEADVEPHDEKAAIEVNVELSQKSNLNDDTHSSSSSSPIGSIDDEPEEEFNCASLQASSQESNFVSEPELGYSAQFGALHSMDAGISQDFDEALALCSGSFEPAILTAPAQNFSSVFSDKDLFTVEDEADVDVCAIVPEDFDSPDEDEEEEDTAVANKEKNAKIREMFEEEAALSGDDFGSEEDENEFDNLVSYEVEENDEVLPCDDMIREDLARQYIKQKNDEEDRRLRHMMNHYLPDGDLHTEQSTDRSFRFRMRDDKDVDWSKILGNLNEEFGPVDNDDEEEALATQVRERKIEMMKWKMEQEKKNADFPSDSGVSECSVGHSLLQLGESTAKQQKLMPVSVVQADNEEEESDVNRPGTMPRDSLLKNANALNLLFKESRSALAATSASPKIRTRFLFSSGNQGLLHKGIASMVGSKRKK